MLKVISDLGELDVASAAENEAKIALEHPVTKKSLGQYVTILGKDSEAFRDVVKARENEKRQKDFRNSRRGRAPDPTTFEEDDLKAVSLLVSCVTGFYCDPIAEVKQGDQVVVPASEGGAFLRYKGEKLVFNEANAIKFFSDPGMAEFRKQVDRAIVDLENFIKA